MRLVVYDVDVQEKDNRKLRLAEQASRHRAAQAGRACVSGVIAMMQGGTDCNLLLSRLLPYYASCAGLPRCAEDLPREPTEAGFGICVVEALHAIGLWPPKCPIVVRRANNPSSLPSLLQARPPLCYPTC